MSDNMSLMFKIFDPVTLTPYPTQPPEVRVGAIHLLNSMRIGKKITHSDDNKRSWDLLTRASIRSKMRLEHFVKRTRGLNIVADTHAPKDVTDHIVYSVMISDSADNLPYDMFFVEKQDPSVVAAALRMALITVEEYIKILDNKNK